MLPSLAQFLGVVIASTKKGPDISCWEGVTLSVCMCVCLSLCVCLSAHTEWVVKKLFIYFLDLIDSKFEDFHICLKLESFNDLFIPPS